MTKWTTLWWPGRHEPLGGPDPGVRPEPERAPEPAPEPEPEDVSEDVPDAERDLVPDAVPQEPSDPQLRLLAAWDPRISAELRDLRGRMPGIASTLVAGIDGGVLAHDPHGGDLHTAARFGLALLDQGRQASVALGRGRFRNSVIWGADGYLAVYSVGPEALLLVEATSQAQVGRLHVEARNSAATIADLLTEVGQRGQ
jgi:predicted regulator of Ras-like GTPase activity (Roadblock/LC7/MglB family)